MKNFPPNPGRWRSQKDQAEKTTAKESAAVTMGMRWIGLPVIAAQHFQHSTASLDILHDDHDRAVQPDVARWNAAAGENLDASLGPRVGEMRIMNQRALERWENEGGEIPGMQRNQT